MNAQIDRAAALHRQATAIGLAAVATLAATPRDPADPDQRELAERLRSAAARLAPGWSGARLDAQFPDTPPGGTQLPGFVRIGTAQPLDDARFPALVPLFGTGHLTVDADCRDPRVAGLIRAVTLRILAAAPAGAVLVRPIATTATASALAPFAPLADAGLISPPTTDHTGLRAVLTEAERWIRPVRVGSNRRDRHERVLLLLVSALPELTDPAELARIEALARHGPDAGLHLVVAGWPPPPLTPGATRAPLPRATMVTVRDPFALVGNPPGGSFADPGLSPVGAGLNAPVFLDEDPPVRLLDRVCRDLTARLRAAPRHRLVDLLPPDNELWTGSGAAGLTTTVGFDTDVPVTLRFNELTPNWLVGGRGGAGKTSFLVNVVYGLCARYRPEELTVIATGCSPNAPLTGLLESAGDGPPLPHLASAPGGQTGLDHVLATLRNLAGELERRLSACRDAGVTRVEDLPEETPRRILCVVDDLHGLTDGDGAPGSGILSLLESIARNGRTQGIHLLLAGGPADTLAGGPDRAAEPADAGWSAILGQIPVRVALPGGFAVLEPSNDSAAGLPLGTAVINTAGGLGGPRGATRGHERMVWFPDPATDPGTPRRLRDLLRDRLREVGDGVVG